jgi:hypothetical protein
MDIGACAAAGWPLFWFGFIRVRGGDISIPPYPKVSNSVPPNVENGTTFRVSETRSTHVQIAALDRCILVWPWLGSENTAIQKKYNELTIAK